MALDYQSSAVSYRDEAIRPRGAPADPGEDDDGADGLQNVCERFFYACQDANYNVIGIVSANGDLTERYEYTPYGQRTIFSRGWLLADIDDDGAVDLSDFTALSNEYATGDPDSRCDLDGDGVVGAGDYDFLNAYIGQAIADDPLVMHPKG